MGALAMRRFTSPLVRLLFAALLAMGIASTSESSVFVSVAIAPPPIPVYVQPACPGPNYIWVPGYWAWDAAGDGYYWVPGYWALAPYVGALWTPGWWGWVDGVYLWHPGYWGRHVGFYGGINYGFGYFGVGYVGGYWSSGAFRYNTAVTNVNVTIVNNVYNQPATQTTLSRVAFNGGPGGISRQPTATERIAQHDPHRSPTSAQLQHEQVARADRGQWASVNHGTPSVMATKVASFAGTRSGQRAAVPGATTNMPPYRQPHAQSARPEMHAQAAPPVRGEARIEHRAAQPSAPPLHREAGVERRVPSGAAAPMARPEPRAYVARPEVHAQGAPRAQTHAAPPAPRPEMHAQSTPRSEARAPVAPRPEMHAQNAPRMQARAGPSPSEPRRARPPNGQREEERGPR